MSPPTYFVHGDHLGSTRLLTNFPTPTVAESDDYDPFGESNSLGIATHSYTYDAENRIVKVDAGNTATYVYDGEGNRAVKTNSSSINSGGDTPDPAGTVEFLYDLRGRMISTQAPNGSSQWRFEAYADGRHLATYFGNLAIAHSDWLGTERNRDLPDSNAPQYPVNQNMSSLPFGDWLDNSQALAGVGDWTPINFTGKMHDFESDLDYFGARYDSSSMGRFMSPDPGNIGVNRLNAQSWNAYSYSLNNPLSLTDPTGLYVCEDSEKCDSENDKAFAKSLADAQTAANKLTGDDKAAAQRAIDSYGAQGVDNGVNVRFDANVTGGVTEVSGVANGNKSADNPTGQNINVTFNPNSVGGTFDAGLVAHEGSHVADASAWVASGFSAKLNPTNFTTEFDAYHVEFNVGNALLGLLKPPGGGTYVSGSLSFPRGGQLSFNKGDTFKQITPDLQQKINENYKNLSSPAFTKGSVLQP